MYRHWKYVRSRADLGDRIATIGSNNNARSRSKAGTMTGNATCFKRGLRCREHVEAVQQCVVVRGREESTATTKDHNRVDRQYTLDDKELWECSAIPYVFTFQLREDERSKRTWRIQWLWNNDKTMIALFERKGRTRVNGMINWVVSFDEDSFLKWLSPAKEVDNLHSDESYEL